MNGDIRRTVRKTNDLALPALHLIKPKSKDSSCGGFVFQISIPIRSRSTERSGRQLGQLVETTCRA